MLFGCHRLSWFLELFDSKNILIRFSYEATAVIKTVYSMTRCVAFCPARKKVQTHSSYSGFPNNTL